MRNRYLLLLVFFLLSIAITKAQNNMGHHTDNWNGVHSLSFNPAEAVDSRFVFHMNVVSFGTTMSNNYLGIKRTALFKDRDIAFDDPDFSDNYLVERLNGRKKNVYQNLEVSALPSFIANFGKDRKFMIGFNYRVRTNVNANGVDEDLARMSFKEIKLADLYNVGIQNKNFSIQANAWAEYGLSFGMPVLNTGKHFVTAAGTFKVNQGLADVYFYSKNLDVTFPNDSMVSVNNSDLKFGYSSIVGDEFGDISANSIFANSGFGVGFDLGAVWEFRPNIDDYKYELDGNPDYLDPRKEKYKLKVGLGLMDMGFTKYKRSNGVYGEYYADRQNIDIEDHFGAAFDDFENTGLNNFQDTLTSLFVETQASKDKYSVPTPMKINAYVDYNIWKGFYANFTASIAPMFKNNPNKTNGISEFSITPRFEHKWFAFYLPVSANTHGNVHLGTGMRVGPLAFGTNDILPLVGKKKIYDANVYMSLSIPITKKIKDKDKDHVSNKKDNCKKDPGPWATQGCPDKDNDGITDDIDKCPDVAGVEKFKGCPDTDGDGIQDSQDECPEVAGIEEFKGCPDTDGDGIKDSEDKCPQVAGLKEYNGCPDTDGDGLIDSEDDCPQVAGPKENNGCPFADDDKDGVINKEDKCPNTPGPKENNGCPIIEKEVEEALDLAFKNLEFETGKSIIKKSSYSSLDNLTQILKDHPDYRLLVEGHTDSVGSAESNMTLSQARANAVKDFLMKKGVSGDKIITKGFGETKPVASNDTAAGRQENRRVEMTIVFE
ncbi:MAG: OmpA family protein [Bacteroidetes bacterium]|nr:OmpA family protein [Bacteroidota bacterium]MCB9226495.1 OmpA family protein [Chitinophagales bacterium]